MTMRTATAVPPRPTLHADTAADLMGPNPISIREGASVREATALLIDKSFGAAPVIDVTGRPVGVVSQTDILVHDREKATAPTRVPDFYTRSELTTEDGGQWSGGSPVADVDRTTVSEVMTPAVFSVTPETPAAQVIEQMLALRVHRLFVVDRTGTLVGVISLFDILRQLHA